MRTFEQILKNTEYNENQLEYFLAECSVDFVYFAENVLGFQVGEFHKEWWRLAEKYPRLCIMAFRGSGKTNWFAAYFLWKAVFRTGLKFLVTSHNFEHSKQVLKLIRGMVLDNDLLKDFAASGKEATWKQTEIVLENGSTFYCRTFGEGVRGLRIDYLLCDEGGKYDDKSLFWTAVSPVVQLNRGKIIVVGTPDTPVDLLHDLKNNDEYYFDEFPVVDGIGKPAWEMKYTVERRDTDEQRSIPQIKREMGELSFQQEYMLRPISSANALYPWDLLQKNIDSMEKFMEYGHPANTYFVGYDIASSPRGDWTVMTVLEKQKDGTKKIVRAERFRANFKIQKGIIRKLIKDFLPAKIVVDKTGMGEFALQELQADFTNVEPFHFTAEDKKNLLFDLQTEFDNGRIIIPASKDCPKTLKYSEQLLKELKDVQIAPSPQTKAKIKFKFGKYDDSVISLALANRASKDIYGDVSLAAI